MWMSVLKVSTTARSAVSTQKAHSHVNVTTPFTSSSQTAPRAMVGVVWSWGAGLILMFRTVPELVCPQDLSCQADDYECQKLVSCDLIDQLPQSCLIFMERNTRSPWVCRNWWGNLIMGWYRCFPFLPSPFSPLPLPTLFPPLPLPSLFPSPPSLPPSSALWVLCYVQDSNLQT